MNLCDICRDAHDEPLATCATCGITFCETCGVGEMCAWGGAGLAVHRAIRKGGGLSRHLKLLRNAALSRGKIYPAQGQDWELVADQIYQAWVPANMIGVDRGNDVPIPDEAIEARARPATPIREACNGALDAAQATLHELERVRAIWERMVDRLAVAEERTRETVEALEQAVNTARRRNL